MAFIAFANPDGMALIAPVKRAKKIAVEEINGAIQIPTNARNGRLRLQVLPKVSFSQTQVRGGENDLQKLVHGAYPDSEIKLIQIKDTTTVSRKKAAAKNCAPLLIYVLTNGNTVKKCAPY